MVLGGRASRFLLAAVGAAVLAAAAAAVWWVRASGPALPAPPRVDRQPGAVAAHLAERYAAARRSPRSAEAVGALCLAYHADMFFDHAERCYEVAADLQPGAWRWDYFRALLDADRGGGDALAPRLRRVVERAPQFGPAWLRLGDAAFKAGRYDEAEAAWARAAELSDPPPERSDSPAHVVEVPLAVYARAGLARVALVRRDPERARSLLEPIVLTEPEFSAAYRLLADAYRALGREADAARLIRRAARLPPFAPYADPMVDVLARESRNATFLLRLASEATLPVNAAWSEYLTRRAVEFDPANPEAVVKLGRVLRTIGRNDEALQWFVRYHEMVPEDFQGLAHIGSCLSALGRYDEAESYFRRALRGLDDPLTHYNLGVLLAVTGRDEQAIAEYEAALARDPLLSDARINLAAALVRRGQAPRAAQELARALEHDPDNAAARTNLGLVYIHLGRRADGERELREALRIDPGFAPAAEALRSLRGTA